MSARCLRGVCQRRNESGGRWGSIYCGNVSSSSACPDGYVCSLPRPRHGHQSVVLSLEGKELLLVFGGEASLLAGGGEWVLTNSVTSVHFSYNDATSVDLLTSCDLGSSCPQPRRDASVLVMDNGGAGNGRLLVFGGLGCGGAGGSCSQSGLLDFLAGRPSAGAQLLDDLWYLDLQELSQDCVMTGDCQTFLPWTKVDVAGSKPSARFAGAVTIDVSDNELYLFGGVSYESGSFTELNDLNEFPLADPFYKFCSATGQGLTRAVAGVTSKIYLQCQDSFRRPADGARFRIELVSAGSPSLSISPVGLGQGMYEGSYTPVNSGSFLLSIFVGRGGAEHQSLIEGYDANPSNSLHEFQLLANRTNPNPFSLLVAAGTTDALVSTSSGSFLTLTTAGVASSFMLTAKDKHGNLSPGGDIVSVIMTLWDPARQTALEPDLKPETAAISDNSDGSYHVAYRITRAGAYRLSLSVNGQEGMGSPLLLEVASSPADPLRSYVFGDFSNIRTGVSSSLFVQTRDALGNPLRVDRALAPAGSENITFEFCTSVGLQDESVTCEGGSVDLNVGISVEYGISPDGYSSNRSTGMPNYGLYRITYFPFNDGLVYPQVRHGPVYVKCMFDTSGLSVDRMIPSPQEADDCIARILANETAKARRKSLLVAAHAPPRRISSYHHDYFNVQVQATFTSPDTHKLRFWLTWGPVLCGLLGFLLQLAYSLCVWKSRRDIAPVRTIPMSRRSSAVSQPHVQEDKGADSSFLQQLKAGGFLDEAEVGECSDEGKKEETLAIMKKFEMAQNEMISSLKRVARKQPSPSSLNTSSAQSVFILWQPKRSSVEVEEENLEDRTFYS
uniref:Uncharacterized protein n=1 Tax=Hanusia phi TaxID=3032 RepID=A0A7S0H9N7_9CRYP